MKVTNKEYQVLKGIINNDFQDSCGGTVECVENEIWVDTLCNSTGDIQGRELSGVISSLSKKGLVKSFGRGDDAYLFITMCGWALFNRESDSETTSK